MLAPVGSSCIDPKDTLFTVGHLNSVFGPKDGASTHLAFWWLLTIRDVSYGRDPGAFAFAVTSLDLEVMIPQTTL